MMRTLGSRVAEDSWRNKLLLASDYVGLDNAVGSDYAEASAADAIELFGPLDNTSHQCPGYAAMPEDGFCVPCPDDKPLWWLVLRWLKMMLLKIARSYHAKPLILIIAPLAVGLYIGYCFGAGRNPPQLMDAIYGICRRMQAFLLSLGMQVIKLSGYRPEPRSIDTGIPQESSKATTQAGFTESHKSTSDDITLHERENRTRTHLQGASGTVRESGVDLSRVPRHVAVIMDGNRRYGKAQYGDASRGHWEGSSKLVEFAKWCIAEHISVLTVYAFSTENWNRDPAEVATLMAIFSKYCEELRVEALKRNIRIFVLSTDPTKIPANVMNGIQRMETDTAGCTGLTMNICMSYGSRGEILNAARTLATDVALGTIDIRHVDEREFEKRLITQHCGDPDILIRTSGEIRISNYLLWQLAYSELFFVPKPWPAIEKSDLVDIIRTFANGRDRRFGK